MSSLLFVRGSMFSLRKTHGKTYHVWEDVMRRTKRDGLIWRSKGQTWTLSEYLNNTHLYWILAPGCNQSRLVNFQQRKKYHYDNCKLPVEELLKVIVFGGNYKK